MLCMQHSAEAEHATLCGRSLTTLSHTFSPLTSHSLLPLSKPQVATGKIYIHDCSPVTALALFLFGAEPQVFHAQHRVVIDTWIDLRISPRTAVLFKALRKQLFELLESKIANLPANAVQQMEEMAEGGGGGGGGAMSGASPADVRSSASGDVRNEGKAVERPPEKKSVVVVGSKAPVPGQAGWPQLTPNICKCSSVDRESRARPPKEKPIIPMSKLKHDQNQQNNEHISLGVRGPGCSKIYNLGNVSHFFGLNS